MPREKTLQVLFNLTEWKKLKKINEQLSERLCKRLPWFQSILNNYFFLESKYYSIYQVCYWWVKWTLDDVKLVVTSITFADYYQCDFSRIVSVSLSKSALV